MPALTPQNILDAYACGLFPMAESRDDPTLYWVDPEKRGILPLDRFHVPRRLARSVRQDRFHVTIDLSFEEVIRTCAEPDRGRESTWINDEIIALYCTLNRMGHAHSVECWQGGRLAGGLYGVSLGAAFFGESMFSRVTDSSKVALVHLVARLRRGGYSLLDAQFLTEHLERFGAVEIPRVVYRKMLAQAIEQKSDFYSLAPDVTGETILQSITQTS